jgi:hypothetical protein
MLTLSLLAFSTSPKLSKKIYAKIVGMADLPVRSVEYAIYRSRNAAT